MTGPEFRHKRKALGYSSRAHIATALDVSPNTVQRWEATTKKPIPVLVAFALEGLARS